MEIKIKKLIENAKIPAYAHIGDAGMDVWATSKTVTEDYVEYGTGLAFEIPTGYAMLIFPRSSNSKKGLVLANSVGILDSSYRGELKMRYKRILNVNHWYINDDELSLSYKANMRPEQEYEVGDRIGQIMIIPYPVIEFVEQTNLSETERGEGGFGSSGK